MHACMAQKSGRPKKRVAHVSIASLRRKQETRSCATRGPYDDDLCWLDPAQMESKSARIEIAAGTLTSCVLYSENRAERGRLRKMPWQSRRGKADKKTEKGCCCCSAARNLGTKKNGLNFWHTPLELWHVPDCEHFSNSSGSFYRERPAQEDFHLNNNC